MSLEKLNDDSQGGAPSEQNYSIGEYGREIGLRGFDFSGFNYYLQSGGASLVEVDLATQGSEV